MNILCLSWAMPPMLFPRSLQVARTLAATVDIGWTPTVVCADPASLPAGISTNDFNLVHRYCKDIELWPVNVSGLILPGRWQRIYPPRDHMKLWAQESLKATHTLIRQNRHCALISFAQPWIDHLVALRLAKRHNLPWVAHFSDPWVDNPFNDSVKPALLEQWRRQEEMVIRHADYVVFVSKQTRQLVMSKYPAEWSDKAVVIPHCMDLTLPLPPPRTSPRKRLRLVYSGNFYGRRTPELLLQGLRQLNGNGQLSDRLEVRFIGGGTFDIHKAIAEAGLDDVCVATGHVDYLSSMSAIAAADATLVIDAPFDNSVFLPSKLIDYLSAAKPIVGIVPPSSQSACLLHRLECPVTQAMTPEAVASTLSDLLEAHAAGRLDVSPAFRRVSREFHPQQIAMQLNETVLSALRQHGLRQWSSGPQRSLPPAPVTATAADTPTPTSLAEVLSLVADLAPHRVTLVAPFPIPDSWIAQLWNHRQVFAVLAPSIDDSLKMRYGTFANHYAAMTWRWALPPTKGGTALLLGSTRWLSLTMLVTALAAGYRHLIVLGVLGWERHSIARLLIEMSLRRAGLSVCLSLPPASAKSEASPFRRWRDRVIGLDYLRCAPYFRVIEALKRSPPKLDHIPGRIAFFSGSLGRGGAERQMTNTILGILPHLAAKPVIVCDNLFRSPSNDFYLKRFDRSLVDIEELAPDADLSEVQEIGRALLAAGLNRRQLSSSTDLWRRIALYHNAILRNRPEIVHAWMDMSCVFAGFAAALAGVPRIVLSARSVAPYNFSVYQSFFSAMYKALSRLPNVVLLNNSIAGAASYAEWLDIPPDRIQVIHNGLNSEDFPLGSGAAEIAATRQSLGIPTDAKVVGHVLRMTEEKQPLLWVETAAIVARAIPSAHFVAIGDGPMRNQMAERAIQLGIGDRLHLPGSSNEVGRHMSAFDMLLMTSRQEGLPNVLIEAQSLGLPVVSTAAGGAVEAIRNGVTGWVVHSHLPEKLAERVIWVLSQDDWRANVSTAGPDFVQTTFGLDRMVRESLQVYGLSP